MMHSAKNRKFGRERDVRRALLRSLANALIKNERIQTTEARAKELRGFVEPLITKGRTGSVAVRRLISSRLGGQPTNTKKIVDELAKKYEKRPGGYTRIVKLGSRGGDGSKQVIIEFV